MVAKLPSASKIILSSSSSLMSENFEVIEMLFSCFPCSDNIILLLWEVFCSLHFFPSSESSVICKSVEQEHPLLQTS